MNFTFIQTPELLPELAKELQKCSELAIDIECENSLHHHGTFICLIQISSREKNWIIDVLKLKNLEFLKDIFESKHILKVFHDISFDFRVLSHEFKINPKHVFDTQTAAQLLGKEKLGLSSLLEEFFKVKKEEKFQKVDWTRRPLSLEMLDYAAKDTAYLLQLKDQLLQELAHKKREQWMEEEINFLDTLSFSYHQQTYIDLPGAKKMSARKRAILHALFDLREQVAQKIDRPVFMILSNRTLLELVEKPITEQSNWQSLRGIHPLVRNEARRWVDTIKSAISGPEEEYVHQFKKLSPAQAGEVDRFIEVRNAAALKLEIKPHLIANDEAIINCVINKNFNSLQNWQKELIEKEKWKFR